MPAAAKSKSPRNLLRDLYRGTSRRAALFQYGLLAFDVLIVAFFIGVSFVETPPWLLAVDIVLAVVLGADLAARVWIADKPLRMLLRPVPLADAVVIASLLLPAVTESLAFLRVLRAVRLLRSYHVLGLLRRRFAFVRRNEDVLVSIINLVTFLFVMTALVYVTQARINPAIDTYVDALYFTVTALTTTGFGDITLQGEGGRLLAVLIMVFGISLFIRLVQTVFRPAKVKFRCPECGLLRHDPDAVHCKHCGTVLDIPTEGDI